MKTVSVTQRPCTLAVMLAATGLVPASSATAQVLVAGAAPAEFSISAAFHGSGYLVGLQGGPLMTRQVTAQRLDAAGLPVGPRIDTNRTGGAPLVEFGGVDYLMIWPDDASLGDDDLWGVTVSPGGALGLPSAISATAGVDEQRAGLASDGASGFLAVYTSVDASGGSEKLKGRLVGPGLAVGPELPLSPGFGGAGIDCAAYGAGVYVVAWIENGAEVRARTVSPAGALGSVFDVDLSGTPSDGVSVGFDGIGFLAVWSEEVGGAGSGDWQVQACHLKTTGGALGSTLGVSTPGQGGQRRAFLSSDGQRWLVTWTEEGNDLDGDGLCDGDEGSCSDVEGRVVAQLGKPQGVDFTIAGLSGNQFLSPVVGGPSHFVAVWTEGDVPGGAAGDVYTSAVDVDQPQAPAAYCYSQVNSLGCTPLVGWSGLPSATAPLSFDLTAVNVLNQKKGFLYYGVAGPAFSPFGGGTKCALPPTRRTSTLDSGGSLAGADCTGILKYDFNLRIQSGVDPSLIPGQAVHAQFWSRDPAATSNTNLTNAVEMIIAP